MIHGTLGLGALASIHDEPRLQPRTSPLRNILWYVGAALLASCGASTAPPETTSVTIVTDFEGASLGNWTSGPDAVTFSLREDTNSPTRLFFSFRVADANGLNVTFSLPEALDVSPASVWSYTQPVVSADGGQTWNRITDAGAPSLRVNPGPTAPSPWPGVSSPPPGSRR